MSDDLSIYNDDFTIRKLSPQEVLLRIRRNKSYVFLPHIRTIPLAKNYIKKYKPTFNTYFH